MSEVYGLEAPDLPEGWMPLEACIVVKALDENGIVRLAMRYTPGLSVWEALGMIASTDVALRNDMIEHWKPTDDD